MDRQNFSRFLILAFIVAFVTATLVGTGVLVWAKKYYLSMSNTSSSVSGFPSDETAVVDTVKKVNGAVVAIVVSKVMPVYQTSYDNIPDSLQDFFDPDFFNFYLPRLKQNGEEKLEIGGGSGFLVSSDGYIVTNNHVISDEDADYTVLTSDSKKYQTKIVARDRKLDLAILKIEGKNFPYLPFGDSNKIKVGQTVIAIGNALAEFRNTVSVGVISGLSRSILASDTNGHTEELEQLIQTDAAINQGNSGGPLLNLSGEVVGVNVAFASGAENIGFALNSNSVKKLVETVQK